MGGSGTGGTRGVYVLLLAATAVVALWVTWRFQDAPFAATATTVVLAGPASFLGWKAYLDGHRGAADTGARAALLAKAVLAAETRQRAQLTGDGAHRIDLGFQFRAEPANNAAGAAATGHLSGVTAYYKTVRPARLVVTGAPGAGKTVLAIDLVLGLLTDPARTDADPVPVRMSLAGWDTDIPLEQWLAEQVHRRFRDRGLTPADAHALVEQRRILPVLDGLDEMDGAATPVPRRRAVAALRQLNAYQDAAGSAPVILTCRAEQYDELAALDVRMREAARIEIAPVTPAQADAYLTARSTDPTRWASVVQTLYAAPGGTLARSLATPWRLNLAVTVYEERDPETLLPVRRPDDLLAFASPSAVRDHLLGLYLPAACRQHPTHAGRYGPEETHRWLAALARHLAATTPASGTGPGTDLALHELWPVAGARRVRSADAAIAAALVLGAGVPVVPWGSPAPPLWLFVGVVVIAAVVLAAVLLAGRSEVEGPRILHRRGRRGQLWQLLTLALVGGSGFGLASGYRGGWALGLPVGLGIGVAAALGGFAQGLGETQPTDPRRPVRDDLAFGLMLSVAFGLTSLVASDFPAGRVFGFAASLVAGLYVLTGAGRRYLVFLLCARGLPWRLGAFLHWSYGAGLLRVSGVAYQFRHRELQAWLAAHPDPVP
ncbi:NACHT domain-containing protein [Yinghuangia seranimata]|uniref:NACHT domain-containing protein n=1 Tax=Yinghuangia seranimata TaxID=408067 RepID=UPI00248D2244|nr:NACHT domain-containing protein [Yinghuangia seranimata]MDI2129028.1 NACHT domain-containing protein [Yinghuangia seranimata]